MDKKLTVGIVDDEFLARKTLVNYINRYIENVEVVFEAANLPTAIDQIVINKPDAIFLDIEMPGPSGMEIAEMLPQNERPLIVFTTAYAEHAVSAFGMKAVDYLLKPIEVARLKDAVNRLKEQVAVSDGTKHEKLVIPVANGSIHIPMEDIAFLKADGSYTDIHTLDGTTHIASKKLFEVENQLASRSFLRIHRSYVVNMNTVREYVGGQQSKLILNDSTIIPVARARKQEVISFLQQKS